MKKPVVKGFLDKFAPEKAKAKAKIIVSSIYALVNSFSKLILKNEIVFPFGCIFIQQEKKQSKAGVNIVLWFYSTIANKFHEACMHFFLSLI